MPENTLSMDTIASIDAVSQLSRVPDALASEIDGEIVMMSLQTGQYYSLSGTAAKVWQLLETPRTLAELSERVAEEYGVPVAQCAEDIHEFSRDLLKAGLITAT